MDYSNGISSFKYYLLEDSVCLHCTVVFDEYEEPEIEEILLDGEVDVTEEILSFGLKDAICECSACIDSFEKNGK